MGARLLNFLAATLALPPSGWMPALRLGVDDPSGQQSPNPHSPARSLGEVGPLVALLLTVRGAAAVAEAGARA